MILELAELVHSLLTPLTNIKIKMLNVFDL